MTDQWEPEPETLRLGEPARRTVTLDARGVTADALPPRPVLRTRGVLTFAGRWSARPASPRRGRWPG